SLLNLSSVPVPGNMSPMMPPRNLTGRFTHSNRYTNYYNSNNSRYNGSISAKVDTTADNYAIGGGGGGGGNKKLNFAHTDNVNESKKIGKIIKSNLKKRPVMMSLQPEHSRPSKPQQSNLLNKNETMRMDKTLTINDIKKPSAEGKSLLDLPQTLGPNSIRL